MRRLLLLAPLLAAPLLVAVDLVRAPDRVAVAASTPWLHRAGGFAGAAECAACHPDHTASWRRTFHASMTQEPLPEVVRGRFDGQQVAAAGGSVQPFVRGDRFWMAVVDASGGRREAEVALAVGSRRYQQYFERQPRGDGASALVRLPILWHIEAQRWLPLDTVFLEPDGGAIESHAATWNDTCIYCHNTAPEPRLANLRDPQRTPATAAFASRVGDLGIGCEACHGPAAAHADARRAPLARWAAHRGAGAAPAVHPGRLDQERAVAVCGQCHGARLPQPLTRIAEWLTTGPTFRAGERLADHVTPIQATTPVLGGADPELFALRFWGDGTPRLTAYEYQGVTQSACYRRGALTCQSCHAMHAGDPRGQLRPDRLGDAMCTQCHAAIARDIPAHTHHLPTSAGSSCVECHMPRIVYGVTSVHRSHRIDAPDAAGDAASGRPHACTLCHVDRSLAWAGERLRAWWGDRHAVPERRRDRAPIDLADGIATLHAGDAAARAVTAAALGRATATFAPGAAAPLRAHLAVAMGDGYPMVRWFAQQSLTALEARAPTGLAPVLARADHTAGPEARRATVFGLLDQIARDAPRLLPRPANGMLCGGDCRLQMPDVLRLVDLQANQRIAIGE